MKDPDEGHSHATVPLDALLDPIQGIELGYRFSGGAVGTGRAFLIVAHRGVVAMVHDFLVASPGIEALTGQIYVLSFEALERGDPGPAAAPNAVDFLDFLFLPYPADAAGHAHVARHASWSVMRFCERHRLFPETPGEGPGHLLH